MLSTTTSRALQSTRLLVDMSTLSGMKSYSFHPLGAAVGVSVCLFVMLCLFCFVSRLFSFFTKFYSYIKMIHRHRQCLLDVISTVASCYLMISLWMLFGNAIAIATVEEEFFDIDYDHHFWLFMNSLEQQSITLKQKYVQFYVGKYIHPTLGMVSIYHNAHMI